MGGGGGVVGAAYVDRDNEGSPGRQTTVFVLPAVCEQKTVRKMLRDQKLRRLLRQAGFINKRVSD